MLPVFVGKRSATVLAFLALAGLAVHPSCARAADLFLPVTGGVLGKVLDPHGTPQMGADVQLFNRYRHLVARTFSAPNGRFVFADLPVDQYSVQVALDSFLPVSRDKIVVKAGMDSVLEVHLATLFSSIELNYAIPVGAMSDDWKWVLRSSPATRPITRLLADDPTLPKMRPRLFSGTHAMLSVSGGGGLIDSDDIASGLGTGFAVSTNVSGKNQLQLAGSIGQLMQSGPNALALCAIYSRTSRALLAPPPEITVTVAQIDTAAPQTGGSGGTLPPNGAGEGNQVLRTMSVSLYEATDPIAGVHLEYGSTAESVDFVQHAYRISPFARATVNLGNAGALILAYADGGRPDQLTAHQKTPSTGTDLPNDDLSVAIGNVSRVPQISKSNGELELQRTKNYEAGYQKQSGSRTFSASGFYETVSNGRLNVAGDLSALDAGSVLSDGLSTSSTYNIGRYARPGLIGSVDQRIGQSLALSAAFGTEGGFFLDSSSATGGSLASGARFLGQKQSNVASASIRARLPHSGTRILAGYGWVPEGVILPSHAFTTQSLNMAPGLNLFVRQPIPSVFGLPGHFEFTADLRNLLAQGYVPMALADGRTMLIVEAPRAIRGGLSFIF